MSIELPTSVLTCSVSMYLAGTIKKGHEAPDESYWAQEEIDQIYAGFENWKVYLLNPAHRTDSLQDSFSIFGRDMLQVASAEVTFVDARGRRGLGVGAEMMWARMHQKFVVTLAPLGSHYHRTEGEILGCKVSPYLHPFVAALSDVVVESIADGTECIKQFKQGLLVPKTMAAVQSCIDHYVNTQFERDEPMQLLSHLLKVQAKV